MKSTTTRVTVIKPARTQTTVKRVSMKYTGSKSTAELQRATVIHSTRRDTND